LCSKKKKTGKKKRLLIGRPLKNVKRRGKTLLSKGVNVALLFAGDESDTGSSRDPGERITTTEENFQKSKQEIKKRERTGPISKGGSVKNSTSGDQGGKIQPKN